MSDTEEKKTPKNNNLINGLSLVLTGLGIGWLMGLSSSPVVNTVLTAILASAAGTIGILAGMGTEQTQDTQTQTTDESKLKKETPPPKPASSLSKKATPIPLALLVFGITIGAHFGLKYRANGRVVAPTKATKLQKENHNQPTQV